MSGTCLRTFIQGVEGTILCLYPNRGYYQYFANIIILSHTNIPSTLLYSLISFRIEPNSLGIGFNIPQYRNMSFL